MALNLNEEQVARVSTCFRPRSLKKAEVFLSEGQVCRELFLVRSGCLRSYYLTADGKEKTRHLAFAHSLITSLGSFTRQVTSSEYLESVEDSEVLVMDYREFETLYHTLPQWKNFYRDFVEQAYFRQQERLEKHLTLSARGRFLELMQNHPDHLHKVSNRILASYLDIAPETLSRFKSQIVF